MPRPIWNGAISFGLVNVPVKLFTAVSPKDVRFNQLHAADNGRVRQKRVCEVDGEEVDYADIVKGYEIAPDTYVVIEPGELEALDPKATHTIDIEEFVDLDQIDPIFFERPYYVVPDQRAAKPYRLLVEAMARSKKVAIARFVLRTKQYLVAIRAKDGALVLSTMLFADEVVPLADMPVVDGADEVSERELAMAEQLIHSLAVEEFEPEKYHDDYRQQVLALIERKAAGEELVAAAPQPEAAPVVDLLAALEASLAASKAARAAEGGDSEESTEAAAS